jgi:hypothetical protein
MTIQEVACVQSAEDTPGGIAYYCRRDNRVKAANVRLWPKAESCFVNYLALPARRDKPMHLRCFAFHQYICLNHFSTIEAFLKTFKCGRTIV